MTAKWIMVKRPKKEGKKKQDYPLLSSGRVGSKKVEWGVVS